MGFVTGTGTMEKTLQTNAVKQRGTVAASGITSSGRAITAITANVIMGAKMNTSGAGTRGIHGEINCPPNFAVGGISSGVKIRRRPLNSFPGYIALAVLALMSAACRGSSSESDKSGSGTKSTRVAPESSASSETAGSPLLPRSQQKTFRSPTESAAGIKVDSLTPPKAGTYDYRETLKRGNESSVYEGYLQVDPAEIDDSELSQFMFRTYGSRDFEGTQTIWRQEGVFFDNQALPAGSPCSYRPDVLYLKFPLALDQRWTTESICQGDPEPKREISLEGSIARLETVSVAGRDIQAFVINYHYSRSGGKDATFDRVLWFSHEFRLPIRLETTATPPGEPRTVLVEQLVDTEPRANRD